MRPLVLLALLVAAPALGQPALGETSFANSGAEAAQEPFLRGLLLLHSFEYDDAREAFQEAREIDPGFVMAAWGEAMTHNHPIWQRQDRDAAREALQTPPIESITDRERAYLATLAVLFGEGDKEDRDDAYAQAMADLAESYPDDLDARAFYALALLGTAHEGRDFGTYMRAAAVAEEVFDENPRHPGAAHYLIHAYDDPVHAPLGLRPARVYDTIAPAASHALHMPSHIYLALGMWQDVVAMNERSYTAAKAGTDRRAEALNGHGWHALWWWHYAATQLDDESLAGRLSDLAVGHYQADPDNSTAYSHVARIAAAHSEAFSDPVVFDAIFDDDALEAQGGRASSTSAYITLAKLIVASEYPPSAPNLPLAVRLADRFEEAASGEESPSWAVRSAALQMQGRMLLAQGEREVGLQRLREAAQIETEAPLTFGPPAPVVPSSEALGWALLGDDPAAAAVAFEAALARTPNRRQSVDGLQRARALLGRTEVGAADGRR